MLFATDNLFVDFLIWFPRLGPLRVASIPGAAQGPGCGPDRPRPWPGLREGSIGLMEEKIQGVLSRVRDAMDRGLSEEEAAATVKFQDLCVQDENYEEIRDDVESGKRSNGYTAS